MRRENGITLTNPSMVQLAEEAAANPINFQTPYMPVPLQAMIWPFESCVQDKDWPLLFAIEALSPGSRSAATRHDLSSFNVTNLAHGSTSCSKCFFLLRFSFTYIHNEIPKTPQENQMPVQTTFKRLYQGYDRIVNLPHQRKADFGLLLGLDIDKTDLSIFPCHAA
jgi:hypothetical protein